MVSTQLTDLTCGVSSTSHDWSGFHTCQYFSCGSTVACACVGDHVCNSLVSFSIYSPDVLTPVGTTVFTRGIIGLLYTPATSSLLLTYLSNPRHFLHLDACGLVRLVSIVPVPSPAPIFVVRRREDLPSQSCPMDLSSTAGTVQHPPARSD